MFYLDALVKELDPHFEYLGHEDDTDSLKIYVRSNRKIAKCPYCGADSDRVHSRYPRKFRDLPVDGKKVEIIIKNRKFYCPNPECSRRTFAETFDCIPKQERRSQRLTAAVLDSASAQSSVKAEAQLREKGTEIGKSTICRLLKKQTSPK